MGELFICFGCDANTSLSFSLLPSILFLLTLAHPSLFHWLFFRAVHKPPVNPCTDMRGKCVILTINISWDTLKMTALSLSFFILQCHTLLHPLISWLHRKTKHKQRCIKVAVSGKTFTMGWAFTKHQRVIAAFYCILMMPYLLYTSTTPKCAEIQRGPSGNENGLRRRVEYESHIWLCSASIWLDWALSLFTKRYDAIKTQHKWAFSWYSG